MLYSITGRREIPISQGAQDPLGLKMFKDSILLCYVKSIHNVFLHRPHSSWLIQAEATNKTLLQILKKTKEDFPGWATSISILGIYHIQTARYGIDTTIGEGPVTFFKKVVSYLLVSKGEFRLSLFGMFPLLAVEGISHMKTEPVVGASRRSYCPSCCFLRCPRNRRNCMEACCWA